VGVVRRTVMVMLAVMGAMAIVAPSAPAKGGHRRYCGTDTFTYQGTTFRDNVFSLSEGLSCRESRLVDNASTTPPGWTCGWQDRGLDWVCRGPQGSFETVPWTGGRRLPHTPRYCGVVAYRFQGWTYQDTVNVLGGSVSCGGARRVGAVAETEPPNVVPHIRGWACDWDPNSLWVTCQSPNSVFRATAYYPSVPPPPAAGHPRYCGTITYQFHGRTYRDNVFLVTGRLLCMHARDVDYDCETGRWKCRYENQGLWLVSYGPHGATVRAIPWAGGPSLPVNPRYCGLSNYVSGGSGYSDKVWVLGGPLSCADALGVDRAAESVPNGTSYDSGGWQCDYGSTWILCFSPTSIFKGVEYQPPPPQTYNCADVVDPITRAVNITATGTPCSVARQVAAFEMVDLSCNGGGQTCPILGFTCTGEFVTSGQYPSDTHFSCLRGGADVEFDDVTPAPSPAADRLADQPRLPRLARSWGGPTRSVRSP
jgi:hypothetical protein